MKYLVKFSFSGSSCESEMIIDNINDFVSENMGNDYLIITGDPILVIKTSNIESVSFKKVPQSEK